MLCRTTNDCSWLDKDLLCQDSELDITPNQTWFGGDFAKIVGKCRCGDEKVWEHDEVECEQSWSVGMIVLFCLIGVVALLLICCVCYCALCVKNGLEKLGEFCCSLCCFFLK